MRGRFLVPPVMRRGHKYTRTNAKENLKDTTSSFKNHMKENYNPRDPFFVKDTEEGRNINNLWSGYKLGGKGKLLVTGSLLGGGSIIASNPQNYQDSYNLKYGVEAQSEMQDVESLISTRGDGQGYVAQHADTPDLSSSGDLVFAMHKTRHTGQF